MTGRNGRRLEEDVGDCAEGELSFSFAEIDVTCSCNSFTPEERTLKVVSNAGDFHPTWCAG